MERIDLFRGRYAWLSNFWPSPVEYDGLTYPSVENAYQAAKVRPGDRGRFLRCSSGMAKRMGRTVDLPINWDLVRIAVMHQLLTKKFGADPLMTQLLDTGDAVLIEGNDWGDRFWGACDGEGENWLGRLLMLVRSQLARRSRKKE